jgi:hypothetical protein
MHSLWIAFNRDTLNILVFFPLAFDYKPLEIARSWTLPGQCV